jgi:hypothetical protein
MRKPSYLLALASPDVELATGNSTILVLLMLSDSVPANLVRNGINKTRKQANVIGSWTSKTENDVRIRQTSSIHECHLTPSETKELDSQIRSQGW